MRTVYREHLQAFNEDVLEMCDAVRDVMGHATAALLEHSLEDAEAALTAVDELKEISQRCEERSMSLLALHSPVAYDLRQVISAIYIVESFDRMGSLAKNVALLARQRHPNPVYPEPLQGYVQELARLVYEMGAATRKLLDEPDADAAVELHTIDEGVDDMKAFLCALASAPDWQYTNREAVDLSMLARYYERYADRCVSVGRRMVFLITGLQPEAYVQQRDEVDYDPVKKFATIERKFRNQK
ncbi:PhoU family transcriptional regulator [Corynebacterium sp. HMSC05H05]|nr:PhoU family transcriptional regulator [Corynebacterium sp. HMSC05H05]OHR24218.1 PhoU family transcriptional regulator [Corynebacterium sp. HMSC034A01]